MNKPEKKIFLEIQKQKHMYFDSDALSEVVKGASFELYQLDKGAFRSDLLSLHLDKGILDKGYYNRSILTKGIFSEQHMTFGFVHTADKEGHVNGESISPHDILLADSDAPLDYVLAPNSHWSTFQFKKEDLPVIEHDILEKSSRLYHLDPKDKQHFSSQLNALFSYLETLNTTESIYLNTEILYNHLLTLYSAAINKANNTTPLTVSKSALLANKIYTYLQENAEEPVQMIHLCRLIQKSERTVERIFKKHFNVSPYSYLKLHRLHLIRRQLKNADPKSANIMHIAMKNGFMQMGYFGSEYKKTFGETPSETLRGR